MGTRHRRSAREVRALDAFVKLMRCRDGVLQSLQPLLQEEGVSSVQLGAMEAIYHLGPLSQSELCEKMLRSEGSVSVLVDRLERRGWARRKRSAEDRRIVHVHLTPSGRRRIGALFPKHAADVARCFAALTAKEQQELARLCRKLGLAQAPADGS